MRFTFLKIWFFTSFHCTDSPENINVSEWNRRQHSTDIVLTRPCGTRLQSMSWFSLYITWLETLQWRGLSLHIRLHLKFISSLSLWTREVKVFRTCWEWSFCCMQLCWLTPSLRCFSLREVVVRTFGLLQHPVMIIGWLFTYDTTV